MYRLVREAELIAALRRERSSQLRNELSGSAAFDADVWANVEAALPAVRSLADNSPKNVIFPFKS